MAVPLLSQVHSDLNVLAERVKNLKEDLQNKHGQNRGDIHKMRNEIESLGNQIWMLKLKVASYSGLGSGIVVGISELIKLWVRHTN